MKVKYYQKNTSQAVKKDTNTFLYGTIFSLLLFSIVKYFVPTSFSSISTFLESFANFFNFSDVSVGSANITWLETLKSGSSLLLSTIYISVTGAVIGIAASIPLGIIASRTINKIKWSVTFIRLIMSMLRATPPLLYAYLLSNVFSSSLTGVITLAIFVMTIMTKWLYEDIDSFVFKTYDLFIASGMSGFEAFRISIMPFLKQRITSYGLYCFEISIKFSSILGVVGIVGIGRLFERYQSPENWGHLLIVLILLLIVILAIEFLKNYIIKNILNSHGEELTLDDNYINYTTKEKKKLRVLYTSILIIFLVSLININFKLASKDQLEIFYRDFWGIWKPNWSYLFNFNTGENALQLGLQALLVAIDSIVIATIFAIPLGILSSEKISSTSTVKILTILIAILRVIPLYIYAIVFVVLSPNNKFVFAGSLALGFSSIGSLSKLIFESVDTIPESNINLMKASGMNKLEIIRVAIFPRIYTTIVSQSLYRLEINFKESLVIGALGASAFGYQMMISVSQTNNFNQLLPFWIVTVMISLIIEMLLNLIRNKIQMSYWTKKGSLKQRKYLEENKLKFMKIANAKNIKYDSNDINSIYDAYLIASASKISI